MPQFIPHFSGNLTSSFLERFLVCNALNAIEPDNASVSVAPTVSSYNLSEVSDVCKDFEKSSEKIKESLEKEKNIYSEEVLKNALKIEGEDYQKYKKASTEIAEYSSQHYEKALEINNSLKSLVATLNKDLAGVDNESLSTPAEVLQRTARKREIIREFKHQKNDLIQQREDIKEDVEAKNEEIWRSYFPENSGVPSRKESVLRIHAEKKRQEQAHESALVTMYLNGEYPKQDVKSSVYVKLRAEMILDKYKEMDHLNAGEPFKEIIEFVNSGGATKLSLGGRKILRQMKSDTVKERFEKGIKGDVRRVQRLQRKTRGNSEETEEEFTKRLHVQQAGLLLDTDTYQLAMIEISDQARTLISDDQNSVSENNKNRAKKLGVSVQQLQEIEEVQQSIHELNPEEQKFLETIVPQGYIVKNNLTNNYKDGATPTLGVDKVNLENFFLYEAVGTWGIITVIANVMVAFKNDNWEQAIPYILAGGAATYTSADMVFNHTLDKMREPEKMAQWIFQEKYNEHYEEFFGDDDEMALWENIQWPVDKSGIRGAKKDLKGIKDTKDDYQKKHLSKTQKEEVDFIEKTQHLNVSETLTPEDFAEGGNLAKYLPDTIEINGNLVSKSVLLERLTKSRGGPGKNKMRYEMFKKTISRIGDSDSYLPHLHTLRGYAKEQKQKKCEIKDATECSRKSKIHLYKKVENMCQQGNVLATTPAHKIKN